MMLSFRFIKNIGLLALVSITLFVALSSLFTTRKTITSLNDILVKEKPILQKISLLHTHLEETQNYFLDYFTGRESDMLPVIVYLNTVQEEAHELSRILPDSEKEEVSRFAKSVIVLKDEVMKISEKKIPSENVIKIPARATSAFKRTLGAIKNLTKKMEAKIDAMDKSLIEENKKAQALSKVYILLALLFSAIVIFFMNRALATHVRFLRQGVERVSRGDLNYHIDIKTKDDFGQLVHSFNKMTKDLREIIASRDELNREIERRRKAEENVMDSEVRFRELFDNMSSGVVIYEAADEGKDFILKNINKAGERISKVKKTEVTGKRVMEIFPGVYDFGLLSVFQRVWKTGDSEYHPPGFYADGRIAHWVENHVFRLPNKEIVTIYEDITERKKAEEKEKLITVQTAAAQAEVEKAQELTRAYSDLREKTTILERFQKVTIDREFQMVALKKEIDALLEKMGQPRKYNLQNTTDKEEKK